MRGRKSIIPGVNLPRRGGTVHETSHIPLHQKLLGFFERHAYTIEASNTIPSNGTRTLVLVHMIPSGIYRYFIYYFPAFTVVRVPRVPILFRVNFVEVDAAPRPSLMVRLTRQPDQECVHGETYRGESHEVILADLPKLLAGTACFTMNTLLTWLARETHHQRWRTRPSIDLDKADAEEGEL